MLESEASYALGKEVNIYQRVGIDEDWCLDADKLEVQDKIGEGEFGEVRVGLLVSTVEDDGQDGLPVQVAIKTLKTDNHCTPVRKVRRNI